GVTGFTPSVRRAAVAVWVSALGVWVWGPADVLTSLAAAGILMTAANSYAVWDIGFELSFAAVVGTVAGKACIRRMRDAHDRRFWIKAGENRQRPVRRPWFNRLPERLQGLAESACIAACASAATFPVLVLRGLSVSAWAVVSSIAVLWMVQPLLLLGLAVAFVGLVPWLAPLHGVLSRAADLLTGLLNGWAVWLSTKPGAAIYFDTAYAALVCLLLCGLGVLAFRWRVRLRVALPGILLAAAVGIGLGNALSRDVVHIDLVGSAQAPAVVIAQNDRAVVLFRGGSAAQRAVENQLARRGVRTVELVVDLRMNAKTACTLPAQQGIRAERLPVNASRKLRCTPAAVELLRTREGCLVRLSIGNRQFVTLSGKAELAQPLQTEWLIATPKEPEAVQYQKLLALRSYSWMPPETQYTFSLSLRRTGGEKLG
ncbi:MAG: ComEC/Rec2 family competence protein, partial [Faecalibacterium sp.]|nr:ComEC/Rec2 family competence protein [Faecalibacterium sp.]